MNRLIVICGLPGVGKTSVASSLAGQLRAVHLSIDAVEDSILACGLPAGWSVGVAAYEAARSMAEMNLALGHDVVVDAVNDSDEARQTWRRAAEHSGARLEFIHLICSDRQEHRRPLVGRDRGFTHVAEPAWEQVLERDRQYAPWVDEHLEVDTATQATEVVAVKVLAAIGPAPNRRKDLARP